MNFTSKTYKAAIKQSLEKEKELIKDAQFFMAGQSPWRWSKANRQIKITRRLQARKRRERK